MESHSWLIAFFFLPSMVTCDNQSRTVQLIVNHHCSRLIHGNIRNIYKLSFHWCLYHVWLVSSKTRDDSLCLIRLLARGVCTYATTFPILFIKCKWRPDIVCDRTRLQYAAGKNAKVFFNFKPHFRPFDINQSMFQRSMIYNRLVFWKVN